MSPEHLLAFNVALLAAMASPGPAMMLALRNGVRDGRASGIATGAGLALVAAGWTGAALLGLDRLFVLVPPAYMILKTGGALYLIWIAWSTWRDAGKEISVPRPARNRRAFIEGVTVNLTNPKSVLFSAAVLVVIFPAKLGAAQAVLVVANHFVVEATVYTLLATLLATPAARDRVAMVKPALDRITASVLGALGIRLLVEK